MAALGGFSGAPQNQTGGINSTFNSNGTNSITTGGNFTPANWMSVSPQAGVGSGFWIKFTSTGFTGAATGLSLTGSFLPMTSALLPAATGGAGTATFSYQISSSASGSPVVASGTGTANNTI